MDSATFSSGAWEGAGGAGGCTIGADGVVDGVTDGAVDGWSVVVWQPANKANVNINARVSASSFRVFISFSPFHFIS